MPASTVICDSSLRACLNSSFSCAIACSRPASAGPLPFVSDGLQKPQNVRWMHSVQQLDCPCSRPAQASRLGLGAHCGVDHLMHQVMCRAEQLHICLLHTLLLHPVPPHHR